MEKKTFKSYHLIFGLTIAYYLLTGLLTVNHYVHNGSPLDRQSIKEDGVMGVMNEIIGIPSAGVQETTPYAASGETLTLEDGTVVDENGLVVSSPYLPEGWGVPQDAIVPAVPADNPAGEAEPATQATQERHFYRLQTINRRQILNLRENPSLSAKILYRMPPGTPGYVLHKGEYWSYIVAETRDGTETGFASNLYLNMEEIPPEELPQQYLSIEVPEHTEDPKNG